jgi:hypothetical protein
VAYRGGATKKIGSVVATAVLCRFGTTRECQKMGANRNPEGRLPCRPKPQARKRRFPNPPAAAPSRAKL